MSKLIDKLNELNEQNKLEYNDYSQLFDMASELEDKVTNQAQFAFAMGQLFAEERNKVATDILTHLSSKAIYVEDDAIQYTAIDSFYINELAKKYNVKIGV